MFKSSAIKNVLKQYVKEEKTKFILYPFGENGYKIKKILKNYFNIEPCYLVDNQYCKYNKKIIDKHTLKEVYQADMYVFLTVDNSVINSKIKTEILQYILPDHIINIIEC